MILNQLSICPINQDNIWSKWLTSAKVIGTLVCHEVPGVAEGSNHSLVEGTLLCSSQVLLQLLHSRHANDDSITLFTLEYQVIQCQVSVIWICFYMWPDCQVQWLISPAVESSRHEERRQETRNYSIFFFFSEDKEMLQTAPDMDSRHHS